MIHSLRKNKEVGYFWFNAKEEKTFVKTGLLLAYVGWHEEESLILNAKTGKIDRVDTSAILQGKTLKMLKKGLAKCFEDDGENRDGYYLVSDKSGPITGLISQKEKRKNIKDNLRKRLWR